MILRYLWDILDEVRIWTTDRTDLIATCMDTELGFNSGECGRRIDSLIGYIRFNEGVGSSISDTQGFGSGSVEYPDPNNAGSFLSFDTGWTTATPF
jgi:hypothetical protein